MVELEYRNPPIKTRIFLSAGEVSGDLYGSELARCLKTDSPQSELYGVGGPLMQAQGITLLENPLAHSTVGLTENIKELPFFLTLLHRLKAWLRQMRPDVLVLIDFQGLNLNLAAYAKELGIPSVYLMAPQAWIWGSQRKTKQIARTVTHILSVFPPEARVYQEAGAKVSFIGHPLLGQLPTLKKVHAREKLGLDREQPVVCFMPGSRKAEVKRLAPHLTNWISRVPQAQVLWPRAAAFLDSPPQSAVTPISFEQRYLAMLASDCIIGASGNMILEAVLLKRPVIATYQVSGLTYQMAKRLVRTPWVTLPNLLLNEMRVPEFIQDLPDQTIAKLLAAYIATEPDWLAPTHEALWDMLKGENPLKKASEIIVSYTKGNHP